jgi:hypothetical protein
MFKYNGLDLMGLKFYYSIKSYKIRNIPPSTYKVKPTPPSFKYKNPSALPTIEEKRKIKKGQPLWLT